MKILRNDGTAFEIGEENERGSGDVGGAVQGWGDEERNGKIRGVERDGERKVGEGTGGDRGGRGTERKTERSRKERGGNPYEITDLKPAVRNEQRVNVFLGGEFAFSLDVAQVVDFRLKRGMVVTEVELGKLRKASNFGKLYQRTLEWVLTRPRSVRETRDYLRRKQRQKPEYAIGDEDITAVVERLMRRGYLDDVKFTTYYIENRFQKKGISRKRLRMELIQKGIAGEVIEEAMAETGRDEAEEIKKMIARKRGRYETEEKLIAYLVRQGFDFGLVQSCVRGKD